MKHYSSFPPRPTNFMNGIATDYRGFKITDRFEIYKDGKLVRFPDQWSLQDAKAMIDASLAATELSRAAAAQRKVKITYGHCELENGQEQREYEENKMNEYFENELHESAS